MKQILLITLLAISAVSTCGSCSKKPDSSNHNSRNIKYEITGTFSGRLTIVYSDNINGNTTVANTPLPWTKEIVYGSNVLTIGIGAQAAAMGASGQTAIIKIYSNGKMVKTSSATAGSSGEILIPAVAFGF